MSTVSRQRDAGRASRTPLLLLFGSRLDGRTRRAEGYVAQVLQRRHNHDTFSRRFIDRDQRPDLFERFRIERSPTLLVVDDRRVRARLPQPRNCREIQALLEPWLK